MPGGKDDSSDSRYRGHYKVGSPYKVKGQWYYPKKNEYHDEVGMASWYGIGDGFHGKMTANGDKYNHQALTAAHRTLPLPSVVRVTNLDNNQSVILMVNDRGPFSKKRVIDVSAKAADKLKMKGKGVAKVRVQYLQHETKQLLAHLGLPEKEGAYTCKSKDHAENYIKQANDKLAKNNKSTQVASRGEAIHSAITKFGANQTFIPGENDIFIQLGSYNSKKNAVEVAQKYSKLAATDVTAVKSGKADLYNVRLGPIRDRTDATNLLAKVIALGNNKATIIPAS
jgi:rare lipoprotein A